MTARPTTFQNLTTGESVPAAQFRQRVDGPLIAIAGIGNPRRFSRTLAEVGLAPVVRVFADHHVFTPADLEVPAGTWMVTTEKDAQRMRGLADAPDNCWFVTIVMEPSEGLEDALVTGLRESGIDV